MQQVWDLVAQLAKYFASQLPFLFFFKGVKGRHQVKVMRSKMADVNFNLLVPLNIMHEFH